MNVNSISYQGQQIHQEAIYADCVAPSTEVPDPTPRDAQHYWQRIGFNPSLFPVDPNED